MPRPPQPPFDAKPVRLSRRLFGEQWGHFGAGQLDRIQIMTSYLVQFGKSTAEIEEIEHDLVNEILAEEMSCSTTAGTQPDDAARP